MSSIKQNLSKRHRGELLGLFVFIILSTLIISITIVSLVAYHVVNTGAFNIVDKDLPGAGKLILFIAFLSVATHMIFVVISGKIWLKPVKRLLNGMEKLASGDYSARMSIGKPFGKISVLRTVSDSFNKMAEELQNTEMLRSDFINNFSHEFKTPIVSIAGFAKVLKRGDLSDEQKKEYVDIIEEEALRLSYMANNVLNLTKVENQRILTDIKTYNLSEQLRSCILLLEEKWTKKHLELYIDFKEYMISANEELLKHVWINLFDNAVKFSPDYGILEVTVEQNKENISVSISNNGPTIPEESRTKIFNKFYQADESHASAGNGVGLAIVKKVIELHHGKVSVNSEENLTTFTVELPKEQQERVLINNAEKNMPAND